MIIAIIGPDGSGKTTYVQQLRNQLENNGQKVKIYYPFNYFLLRKFINYFKKSSSKKNKITGDKQNANLILKLWPILALIDNWIDYLVNLYFYNGIVICERYYYDLATSYKEFGYTFNWLYDIYLKIIPQPDKCFVLNTSPQTLCKRETDDKHQIYFFKRQTVRYANIANIFNFQIIDVSKPKTYCLDKIINNINIPRLKFEHIFSIVISISIFGLMLYLFLLPEFSKINTLIIAYATLAIFYQKIDAKLSILITIILLFVTTIYANAGSWIEADIFGIYTYYFLTITIISEFAKYLLDTFYDEKNN